MRRKCAGLSSSSLTAPMAGLTLRSMTDRACPRCRVWWGLQMSFSGGRTIRRPRWAASCQAVRRAGARLSFVEPAPASAWCRRTGGAPAFPVAGSAGLARTPDASALHGESSGALRAPAFGRGGPPAVSSAGGHGSGDSAVSHNRRGLVGGVDERRRVSRHVRLPVHAPWLCAHALPNTAPSWQVHVIARMRGRLIIAAKDRKSVVHNAFAVHILRSFGASKRKTVSSASTSDG